MKFKGVYSTKAEKYAKYRWDYASNAIREIEKITQLSSRTTMTDIGAGTGILTKHFVEKVKRIYAIEPNAEMRDILTRKMEKFRAVSVCDATAENTGLSDNLIDIVTVGQAIHWFDPEPAKREMMRIIKVGGWLVLLRNYVIDSEQNRDVRDLMTDKVYINERIAIEQPEEKPTSYYYESENIQTMTFTIKFTQDWEEFIGALTTVSFMPDENHPNYYHFEKKARDIFIKYCKDEKLLVEGETELIIGQPSKNLEKAI